MRREDEILRIEGLKSTSQSGEGFFKRMLVM